MSAATVLIAEDDLSLREALCDTLSLAGYRVIATRDGEEALSACEHETVDLLVSDVQMQPMDGYQLLRRIKQVKPDLPVVLMTAFGTIQKAVDAMREGAADYLVKPFDAQALLDRIARFARPQEPMGDLIASDARSRDMVALAKRVAATEATVMILGESGTGKEVIARYIHNCSKRAEGPFIAINCAAIPDNMLEAVLFGYEKGAFTGAYQSTPGKFEQAQGGTLLLDEISEMEISLQAKLLRVLQEREVERLGGRKTIALDVRVLATSNRNLREYVAQGKFREDLYYRLNVFPITLKPLRERSEDILPLTQHLIARRWQGRGLAPTLTESAIQRLVSHTWPGNVRELDNVVQRALIFITGSTITEDAIHFEQESETGIPAGDKCHIPVSTPKPNLEDDLKRREQRLIIEALQAGNGSRKYAAEKLGISPRTLRYKLARLREEGVVIPC